MHFNIIKLIIPCLFLIIASCDKDEDENPPKESIVGTWKGTSLHYSFTPARIGFGVDNTDDDFDAIVEFKEDGTVIYSDDGQETTGSYTISNNKITTTIDLTSLPISTGTLKIEKLSKTKLELEMEEDGEFEIPEFGPVNGTIEATLFFDRQ